MNSRQLNRSLLLASLLAFAGLAQAQAAPDQRQFTSDKPMEPFLATPAAAPEGEAAPANSLTDSSGAETRAWIDLQASGSAAVGDARPMPGEVADAVYQRYVNSFKQPIPAQFQRSGSENSDSGAGAGSGGSSGSN